MIWIAVFGLVIAIILLLASLRAFFKLHWCRGLSQLMLCCALLALSFTTLTIASLIYTFYALSSEQCIATVKIKQFASQDYQLTLTLLSGKTNTYEIRGDQWLLSGQVLVWKNLGQLLGLHSRIRLYRLEGMYNDLNQERTNIHSAYDLTAEQSPSWWQSWPSQVLLNWLSRTVYGSAVYMPLTDGAQYQIDLSQTGLIAVPISH